MYERNLMDSFCDSEGSFLTLVVWQEILDSSFNCYISSVAFSPNMCLYLPMEFAQLLWRRFTCFHIHSPNKLWMIMLSQVKIAEIAFSLLLLTVSFSIPGHKWDVAHREARLAKCYDLCHSHLQVLWDLTLPSPPPCSCSTIRATQTLLSSSKRFNSTLDCYTSLNDSFSSLHATAPPSHAACQSQNIIGHALLLHPPSTVKAALCVEL